MVKIENKILEKLIWQVRGDYALSVKDLWTGLGISSQTYYNWIKYNPDKLMDKILEVYYSE